MYERWRLMVSHNVLFIGLGKGEAFLRRQYFFFAPMQTTNKGVLLWRIYIAGTSISYS